MMLVWIPRPLLFLTGMFRLLFPVSWLDHSLPQDKPKEALCQSVFLISLPFIISSLNKIRIYGMTYFDEEQPYSGHIARPVISAGNGRLSARSIKIFGDGIPFYRIDNIPSINNFLGALRTGGAAVNISLHGSRKFLANDLNLSSTRRMLITQPQTDSCVLILRSSSTSYRSSCAMAGKWYVQIISFPELPI